jgi:hypothetical protein
MHPRSITRKTPLLHPLPTNLCASSSHESEHDFAPSVTSEKTANQSRQESKHTVEHDAFIADNDDSEHLLDRPE